MIATEQLCFFPQPVLCLTCLCLKHTASTVTHTLSLHDALPILSESVNFCVMEAIKLCRLDTPIIFIEARINDWRIQPAEFYRSEERFSRNAENDLVCGLLLEKKNEERHPEADQQG